MKHKILFIMIPGLVLLLASCGPNCYREQEQLQDCMNVVLAGGVICSVAATAQTDATSRLADSSLCLNGVIGGVLGCSTQVHPYCAY